MTPEQLSQIHVPSDPRLSPDGTRVAFVVSTPNLDDDRYDRVLWVEGEQFTRGPGDSSPRWSPNGSELAFLRSVDGKPAQVSIIPSGGGEARVLTSFDGGVEALEWSPDGDKLVAVAVSYTEEWAGLDDEERSRRPRRIHTVPYRFDTRAGGWTHDRKRHLWLVTSEEKRSHGA
jgi:dipeptidyl aminopeptidase/acylaminoacyl peptidase